jgi:plasmid stabilization system protein ParE
MKIYTLHYTDQSIINLVEIGDYIGLDSPARADLFIDDLTLFIENTLSLFPYSIAPKFPHFPTVRIIPFHRYNIYYQVFEETLSVEILHIFNSAKVSPFENNN